MQKWGFLHCKKHARNVRNIVLMRPVNSMIEFKQIIGRGTRLFDHKDYFTVYDFVKAYQLFSDPAWDGDPVCEKCGTDPCSCEPDEKEECSVCGKLPCECPPKPCPVCGQRPCVCEVEPPEPCPKCHQTPCVCIKKVKIKLADGKERTIQHMTATSFWSPDGKPMSATQFVEGLYGELPELFKDEDELRSLWSNPDTRKKLLTGLEEKGYGQEQLREISKLIDAEYSDLFDVLAYIAYALPTITREERVEAHKDDIYGQYSDKQNEFLSFILGHYIAEGVNELDQEKLPNLLELKYHSVRDAVDQLGSVGEIQNVFIGFQEHLYRG